MQLLSSIQDLAEYKKLLLRQLFLAHFEKNEETIKQVLSIH